MEGSTRTQRSARFVAAARRHPQVVRRLEWLQRHPAAVAAVAAAGIAFVVYLDLRVEGLVWAGFYLVPLTLLAVSMRPRVVGVAAVVCLGLTLGVMFAQDMLNVDTALVLVYGVLAGGALVMLSYLLERVSLYSSYAIVRAQMAEATADIIGWAHDRDDLDEMLEYALERLGEQVDAVSGVLLLREDGAFAGAAGFGLGRDARAVRVAAQALPAAPEALAADRAVVRDATLAGDAFAGELAGFMSLERALVLPLKALDKDVGVVVLTRPRERGDYREEQILFAEAVASDVAVAVENAGLMIELSGRRRALELVRDASLDFAQAVETSEIHEAVVMRLLTALDMDACDIYDVDVEHAELRLLVNYGASAFDEPESGEPVYSFEQFASSAAAVHSRGPIVITSADDPRLSEVERAYFLRNGHKTQLSISLRIRDRVIGLVELFDNEETRALGTEELDLARTICRFAALALDKARLYDEQRATARRLDRQTVQLTQLQAFSLELSRSLDTAVPESIMTEVGEAVVELVGVRAAAIVSCEADVVGVRKMVTSHDVDPAALEADLLGPRRPLLTPPTDPFLSAPDIASSRPVDRDGLLIAPIESDAPVNASLLVAVDKLDGPFTATDGLLLSTLAAQLGSSLHNAIAYQREHAIAETFQTALLMDPPVIPGIEVGVCYRAATDAARVGGDFYDLVSLGPGRLMVMVGDVCGKGLPAAAQSAVVRYMVRAYAADGSPGEALSRLNSTLLTQSPSQPFVTLVLAYVDVARHLIEYASAGHPRPLVLAGRDEFPVPTEGDLPAGVQRGVVYTTNRVVLPDDSSILMYTDGLSDARRGRELFTERRLRRTLAAHHDLPAQELADAMLGTVADFADGVLDDDSAIVVVKLP
ncbi:MAG TPA: GAF domain-containing SpoIIE family protein phosphatase [Thermoleophilia bacterium]|nr:GAF domain-containing SpoIIE family protein phosphatase [Thermoleophilia bacterium]